MSKLLHEDAGPGAGNVAKRLGVIWPELPWSCPRCKQTVRTHAQTIATVEQPCGPLEVSRATFYCALCDLLLFSRRPDA